jgi:cyclophilin family peptidyl-prolyl cis-trans isomerase
VADEAAGVLPERCPPVEGTDEQTQQFDAAPPFCLDPTLAYSAVIETSLGDVEVDLDQEQAPNTVNSFVYLARNRYFDDTICHRILVDFVAQCGDPTGTGTGGPGYTTSDELPEEGAYEIGSIAMANSGPDTQGSQFFLITGDNGAALPPLYSLFGQVREDSLDVLAEIDARGAEADPDPPTEEVRILSVTIETSPA